MSSKCGVCKETITRDKVLCYGICDKQFHVKCVNLNTIAFKSITENESVKFVCKECDVTSNKTILRKINQLLETLNSGNVDECKDIITKISNNVEDVKKSVKNNEDELKKIKKNSYNSGGESNIKSYAGVLKDTANEPVVLVVPKQKQDNKTTRNEIKEKIDPTIIPIDNIRNAANGTIVIEGKTSADVKLIKECAMKKMGDKYDVKMTELIKPKVLISGVREEMSNDDITRYIKTQNNLNDAHIKVINIFANRDKFSIVVEVDSESFNKLMVEQRVNIGWNRCFVKEYLYVRRCYKCYGYNHNASECTRKKSCKKCAGEHDLIDCQSNNVKCINCVSANNTLKLNLDVDHMASSLDCEVFLRKLAAQRKRVNYNFEK